MAKHHRRAPHVIELDEDEYRALQQVLVAYIDRVELGERYPSLCEEKTPFDPTPSFRMVLLALDVYHSSESGWRAAR